MTRQNKISANKRKSVVFRLRPETIVRLETIAKTFGPSLNEAGAEILDNYAELYSDSLIAGRRVITEQYERARTSTA